MRTLATRSLLFTSGALLLVVGTAVVAEPHAFFAANGIRLSAEASLMSEVRAPGGLLVASGVFVLSGAFRERLSGLALRLSALVYGGYGVARLISLALDGVPSTSLVAATGLELLLGVLSLAALVASGGGRAAEAVLVSPPKGDPP